MPVHNQRWKVARPIPADAEQELFGYPPVLRQILYNRGYHTHEGARQYLQALTPEGSDPQAMLGVPEAVERIRWAIQRGEPVVVYGDYDADGVTATALLTQALRELGAQATGYIPNRFEEGYGLNLEALGSLRADGIKLVITVDCGIRSLVEAEFAKEVGLDLIISDHHHPSGELPQALAVINPKQAGDTYPDKNLSGVGLAYKLASALYGPDDPPVESFLDLVALGTVSDLVPLIGENRALVRSGLEVLRRPQRQGVLSLVGVAGISPPTLNAYHIGFMLGPRLNAAGRLESAEAALELLTTHDPSRAGELAQQLDNQNRERQRLTQEIQEQAESLALADDPQSLLLFAAHPDFNAGVVGLAASRLTERYYRPAIVASQSDEFTRGSCRSIPEFHITDALDECADLLIRHGGHAAAAGFTVHNDKLPELVQRLREIAKLKLAELDLRRTLSADIEIPLYELKPTILDTLKLLEPTGQQNPRAAFVSRNLAVRRAYRIGRDEAHLKLEVSDGRITYSAIAFQQGHWADEMPERIDILYYFELNEYNGRSSLQLNIIDLKPSGCSDD
jgi:single-stranded-DNA-specific exonuclease